MLVLLDPALLCGETAWKNIKSVSGNDLIQCNINLYRTYEQFSVPVIINIVMCYTQSFVCRSTIIKMASMRTFEFVSDNLTSMASVLKYQVIDKNNIKQRQSEQSSCPSARYGIVLYSTGSDLLNLTFGAKWTGVVNITPRPLYLQEGTPVSSQEEAVWPREPVWRLGGREMFFLCWDSNPGPSSL
jgi:hypothetical protein